MFAKQKGVVMPKDTEQEAIRHIRNYLLFHGRVPSVRELKDTMGYKSPRSAALIIEKLIDKGFLKKIHKNKLELNIENPLSHEQTIDVPVAGLISCGTPTEAIEALAMGKIPVSVKLAKPPHKHFFLRARGDSMDKIGIENNDLVLVKQIPLAHNGDIIAAVIDGEATLKEFQRISGGIALKPHSKNPEYKTTILSNDFQVQGVAVKDEHGNVVVLKK